jgi:tetratricopeptide (TPR) repeat protein
MGLAMALVGALWLGRLLTIHPIFATLAAALLYLQGRALARALVDAVARRLLVREAGLRGQDALRVRQALEAMDRGHPDIARATLAPLAAARSQESTLDLAHARACLRLVGHRRFGEGHSDSWAGLTAGRKRPVPYLERALLAPVLEVAPAAVAAEAATVDDATLAELLDMRARLVQRLACAVGRPLDPFFPRAEQDLEHMTGRRFLLAPGPRLRRAVPRPAARRRLPPREEAAALLLLHGREEAAGALLAAADFAGNLTPRGRALRTTAIIERFLRVVGDPIVSPEMFARHTREIFFLHTREIGMTWGSPHLDEIGDGATRLLELLREKRRMVRSLAVLRLRWGRGADVLAPLVRRIAGGDLPGERVPGSARRFLQWWRTRGRHLDDVCVHNLRGLVLLQERRPREAAAEFERSLACDPWFAEAAYNLAWARTGMREHADDPAEPLRRAAGAAPESPEPWILLGEFLERNNRTAEAEACFRRVLQVDPMHYEANHYLGRLLLSETRFDEAADTLRRAMAIRPGQCDVLVSLALVHMESQRPAEAVPLLRAAVEHSDGERREEARYHLHIALKEADRHEEALAALDEVPDRFLRRHELLLEEAAMYLEERYRYERSQRLFERLRELRARRGRL